jgi:hypothetical protein
MSYRAKDGNWYSHKESPEEYRNRKYGYSGYSGRYYVEYPKLRYTLCFISSAIFGIYIFINGLLTISSSKTTAGDYWLSLILIIVGLIIYRIARFDAWERAWIFRFICIISSSSLLCFFIGVSLIGFILSLITIIVIIYDIKDITLM